MELAAGQALKTGLSPPRQDGREPREVLQGASSGPRGHSLPAGSEDPPAAGRGPWRCEGGSAGAGAEPGEGLRDPCCKRCCRAEMKCGLFPNSRRHTDAVAHTFPGTSSQDEGTNVRESRRKHGPWRAGPGASREQYWGFTHGRPSAVRPSARTRDLRLAMLRDAMHGQKTAGCLLRIH